MFLISLIFVLFCQVNESFYFSCRFYDSKAGRFLSTDPVVPGAQSNKGLSRYTYVYNNPIAFDDPDGHVPNDRSNQVRDYDEALEDYNSQLLAGLGYTGSEQKDDAGELEGKWSRVTQLGILGIREKLRANYAIIHQGTGNVASMLHMTGDASEAEMMRKLTAQSLQDLGMTQRYSSFVVNHSASALDAGLSLDDVNRFSHNVDDAPLIFQLSRGKIKETIGMGRKAALSQTPIFFPEDLGSALYQASYAGAFYGSMYTVGLNIGGGTFGVLSSLQYKSDFAKYLGITGGGLEVAAGWKWAQNMKVLAPVTGASLATRSRATAGMALSRGVSLLGGLIGLFAFTIEYAYIQGYYDDPEVPPSVIRKQAEESGVRSDIKDWKGDQFEPCKGNYCLVEGTLVWTPEGFRRIEEIEVSDFVLSPIGQSKVIQASRNEVSSWLQIKTSQEVLSLTANHPLKVENRGWILAGEVEISDRLSNGHEILEIQAFRSLAKVYNLQLESVNIFYVGSSRILVKGLGR